MLSDKTGSLIATAARAGVMFSGADRAYLDAVGTFGEKVGVAFQLVDDVIDLAPATDKTGKIAGNDLRAGVDTLPLLQLRRMRRDRAGAAQHLVERIERDVNGAPDDVVDSDAVPVRRRRAPRARGHRGDPRRRASPGHAKPSPPSPRCPTAP